MQRVPSQSIPIKQTSINKQRETGLVDTDERVSPLSVISRRIREEQGAESLKEFLLVMRPYFAPNELIMIGRRFGIEIERELSAGTVRNKPEETNPERRQSSEIFSNNPQPQQFSQLMQKMLLLQNLMGSGGKTDTNALIKLLGMG